MSNELGTIIEECYTEKNFHIVNQRLKQICHHLLEFQDNLGLPPKAEIKSIWLSRVIFDIDFNHIAEQLQGTINVELKSIDLDGALDQWITNEDILLDSRRMRKLRSYYK